jgi:hypothetical protein
MFGKQKEAERLRREREARAARREAEAKRARASIAAVVKGEVCARMKRSVPELAAMDDLWTAAMANPELLYWCIRAFKANRSDFADLLVNRRGEPLSGDAEEMACGRSLDDVVAMVVRSGVLAWAKTHFAAEAEARRFYDAVGENMRHDWQLRLLEGYAGLWPDHMSLLGPLVVHVRTLGGLGQVASVGKEQVRDACRILAPADAAEVLDVDPLALAGVAALGRGRFESLRAKVKDAMGRRFWGILRDDDAAASAETRAVADLLAMQRWLHELSWHAIEDATDNLPTWVLEPFFAICEEKLGRQLFLSLFGRPGDPLRSHKLVLRARNMRLPPDIEDAKRRFPRDFPPLVASFKDEVKWELRALAHEKAG